jgi:hypothetical protein
MMVREVLGYSPRRVKTFLNAFRLALYIASAQGLLDTDINTGEAEVTHERLGKFLALTSRYPELRGVLDREPNLFNNLEEIALAWRSGAGDLIDIWLEKPGVRKLMSYGIVEKTETRAWSRQYSMKNFPAWKFDTVLPSIPPPGAARTPATNAANVNAAGVSQTSGAPAETPARLARAAAAALKDTQDSSSSSSSRPSTQRRISTQDAAPANSKMASNSKSPPSRKTLK